MPATIPSSLFDVANASGSDGAMLSARGPGTIPTLDPNNYWDSVNRQRKLVGQAAGVGGDRHNIQTSAGIDLVKIDTNGTQVCNFRNGGIPANQHYKVVPNDTLTSVTFNHCMTQGTDPADPNGSKDVVYSMGWNDNGNGAALDPAQVTTSDGWEYKWNGNVERHIGTTTLPGGASIRPITFTVSRTDLATAMSLSGRSFLFQDDGARNTYTKFTSSGATIPSNQWLFLHGAGSAQALALVCDGTATNLDFGIPSVTNTMNLKGSIVSLTFASGAFGSSIALKTDGTTNALHIYDINGLVDLVTIGSATDPIFGAGNAKFKVYSGAKALTFNTQGLLSLTDGTITSFWASDTIGTFTNHAYKIVTHNILAATFGLDGSFTSVGSGSFAGNVLVNAGATPMFVGGITALPGFRGLWFEATQDSSNYGVIGKAGQTLLNVGSGGFLGFLVGNGLQLQINNTGFGFYGATPVGQRSGEITTGLVSLGLFSSATIAQGSITGLTTALGLKADDSTVVKLALASQEITSGLTTNANIPLLSLKTTGTHQGPGLDIHKTIAGGNFGFRFFSPYLAADPVTYLADSGAYYTRMAYVGSSVTHGTGENYRIDPPTLDNVWIAIWMDIDVGVQIRDSGLTGSRSFETLDTTGVYKYAVEASTGKLRWGSTTLKDVNGTPLYDTNLYRSAVGSLKTDGNFQVVGTLIAPTILGAVSVTGFIRTDQQIQFGDNLTYLTESGGLQIVGGPRDIILISGGERLRIKTDTGEVVVANGVNFSFSTTTGTQLGTAATQKLAFWGATPVVRPASTGQTAGFTSGAGTTVDSAATFTGGIGSSAYTIGDIVKAIKQIGVLTP